MLQILAILYDNLIEPVRQQGRWHSVRHRSGRLQNFDGTVESTAGPPLPLQVHVNPDFLALLQKSTRMSKHPSWLINGSGSTLEGFGTRCEMGAGASRFVTGL